MRGIDSHGTTYDTPSRSRIHDRIRHRRPACRLLTSSAGQPHGRPGVRADGRPGVRADIRASDRTDDGSHRRADIGRGCRANVGPGCRRNSRGHQ